MKENICAVGAVEQVSMFMGSILAVVDEQSVLDFFHGKNARLLHERGQKTAKSSGRMARLESAQRNALRAPRLRNIA
ncbi:hypothetical protein EYF80_023455 [Liparis tanakae]|uniref:Uncharacterized protein n=1 Tax=Liparis tanakae TaxID=230148 RepID=A0A4Z2HKB7_9TELE|nr:hypothetical protein EYF80_023455 [Liparis tanakae]